MISNSITRSINGPGWYGKDYQRVWSEIFRYWISIKRSGMRPTKCKRILCRLRRRVTKKCVVLGPHDQMDFADWVRVTDVMKRASDIAYQAFCRQAERNPELYSK